VVVAMTAHLIEGRAAREFLDVQWSELYALDPFATPYQAPQWLRAWARALPPGKTPLVVVADDYRHRPAAALALVRHQAHGLITPLSSPTSEYVRAAGPYAQQPDVIASLARRLTALAHTDDLRLPDLPASSALATHLDGLSGWRSQGGPMQCATVALPIAYDRMSRDTRRAHERRRATWDRLAERSRVTYSRTRTTEELLTAWRELRQLHRQRGPEADPLAPELTSVLTACGPELAFVATLRVGQQLVAAQLVLQRAHRAYSLHTAMHQEWRHTAPGHALIRALAEDLAEHAYGVLDLGRTYPTRGQLAFKAQYLPTWSATVTMSRPRSAPALPGGAAVRVAGPGPAAFQYGGAA
jgi:CelD/BcsL family acetyltransferase involved in cellulose biosynthesis